MTKMTKKTETMVIGFDDNIIICSMSYLITFLLFSWLFLGIQDEFLNKNNRQKLQVNVFGHSIKETFINGNTTNYDFHNYITYSLDTKNNLDCFVQVYSGSSYNEGMKYLKKYNSTITIYVDKMTKLCYLEKEQIRVITILEKFLFLVMCWGFLAISMAFLIRGGHHIKT